MVGDMDCQNGDTNHRSANVCTKFVVVSTCCAIAVDHAFNFFLDFQIFRDQYWGPQGQTINHLGGGHGEKRKKKSFGPFADKKIKKPNLIDSPRKKTFGGSPKKKFVRGNPGRTMLPQMINGRPLTGLLTLIHGEMLHHFAPILQPQRILGELIGFVS